MNNIIDLSKVAELNEGELRAQIDQLVERGTEGRFAVLDRTQGENLPADAIGRQRIVTFSGLRVADLGNLLSRARLLKLDSELKNQLDVIRELQNKLKELEIGRQSLLRGLQRAHYELRDCKTLKEALQNKKAILEIKRFASYNLRFSVLPPEIGELTSLEELCIVGASLVTLPGEIGQLRKLRTLILTRNKFKILPPALWRLTELRVLNLNMNCLEELSPEVEKLSHLQELYMISNRLKEIPPEIVKLGNLSHLKLDANELSDLPSEIWQMTELKVLFIPRNQFSELPPSICQMTELRELCLTYNPFSTLPSSIRQMTKLEQLSLLDCRNLHGLPLEILELPSTCIVGLEGCGLSEQMLTRLRTACNQPGYQGPRFRFEMGHLERRGEEKPTKEILESLFADLHEPYVELTQVLGPDVDQGALCSWLNRLSFLKDFQNTPVIKNWLICNIVSYLKLADLNKDFREIFGATIQGAAETCGDRVALSILHLGIQHRLATLDLKDIKGLAEFLKRGVFAVSLLEEIARNKVPTLPFFDEIEVYLTYPVMLKKVLDLPIDVEEMLYFGCAGVTEDDLNEAAGIVKKQMEGGEFLLFLIGHEKWLKALEVNYPKECEKLREMRAEDAELEGADFEELNREYNGRLLDLTIKALGIFR